MIIHAYLFELRAIQPFLFATGKLRDIVSASELIDYLCTEPLAKVLEICKLTDYHLSELSPRCAGGVFYLLIEDAEKVRQFSHLWPLAVAELVPGLEQVHVCAQGDSARSAMAKGLSQLQTARNYHTVQHPSASPLAMRSPRTGYVATERDHGEPVDAATAVKRAFVRPQHSKNLTSRFCEEQALNWPDNFEENSAPQKRFPLAKDNLVGLVHADGNAIGEVLLVLSEATQALDKETYVRLYREFSDGLDRATCDAARLACQLVLVPEIASHSVIPARPLVLGGDDLTVLIKASLALPFTVQFIKQFEINTALFLKSLKASMQANGVEPSVQNRLPEKLTACAGIAYMKHSQPFYQGYELAESLCNRAKNQSRLALKHPKDAMPSSLSFHKIQGSLADDADHLFQLEQVTSSGLELALPVYGINPGQGLPSYEALIALASCFGPGRLNEKRLRSIATLLHSDVQLAQKDYLRWRSLSAKPFAKQLGEFDDALKDLVGPISGDLPANAAKSQSPLADILSYISIHGHLASEE